MKKDDKQKKNNDDLSSGAIAGIVLGVLALIAIVLYSMYARRRPGAVGDELIRGATTYEERLEMGKGYVDPLSYRGERVPFKSKWT